MRYKKGQMLIITLNGKNKLSILMGLVIVSIAGCTESNRQVHDMAITHKIEQEEVATTENMTEVLGRSNPNLELTSETEEEMVSATEMNETEDTVPEEETDIIYDVNWRKIVTSDLDDYAVPYKDIHLEYPRLSENNDDWMIGYEINKLIEEDVQSHLNDISISCSYKLKGKVIYLDEDYISILYQGTCYPATAAWDFAWATTIDMRTYTMVGIEDVAELSGILEKLEQREFEEVRGIDIDYYEKEFAPIYRDVPINWREEYEGLSMDSNDENHNHDFYLKKNKIGILFNVLSSAGDYIIVELDR